VRSYLTEGYEYFQALLARAGQTIAPAIRAKAELGAGRLSWCQDRDTDALRHYRAAQSLYQNLGMAEQVGFIEAVIGFAERSNGNREAARTHFDRAKDFASEQHSERIMTMAVNGLVSLAADKGDFADARQEKESSLASARTLGDQWIVALIAASLGKVCFGQGDLTAAREFTRESLVLSSDLGNKWMVPYAIELLADICVSESVVNVAVQLYGAASAQREALALAFSATELTPYQKSLDRLHELIPAGTFDEEWQKGRSLGIQAAIELAMGTDATERVPARRKR